VVKNGQNPHGFYMILWSTKSSHEATDRRCHPKNRESARLSSFQRQQSGAAFSIGSSKQSHRPQLQPAGEDHLGMGQNPGTVP
jgi:hypothetical protein